MFQNHMFYVSGQKRYIYPSFKRKNGERQIWDVHFRISGGTKWAALPMNLNKITPDNLKIRRNSLGWHQSQGGALLSRETMEKCRFSQKLQGTNMGYFSTATKLTFRRSGSELDLAFELTTLGYCTNLCHFLKNKIIFCRNDLNFSDFRELQSLPWRN